MADLDSFGRRAALAAFVTSAAWSGSGWSQPAARPDRYRIGAMLQLTGTAAASGEFQRNGIMIAVEEINAAGGINGIPLEVVVEDQACNPSVGVNAITKLVHADRITSSMIGCSGVILAATPIAARNGVLLVNAGAAAPALANVSPFLLNSIPLASQQARVMVHHVVNENRLRRIAVYYRNDDLGQSLNEFLQGEVPRKGGQYLGGLSYDPSATSHVAQIARLRAMQPEVIYAATLGNETGTILKQSYDLGLRPRWIGYSGFEGAPTVRIGGQAAEGQLYTVNSTVDSNGRTYPEADRFYEAYRRKHNLGPEAIAYIALQFYEATHMLAASLRQVDGQRRAPTGEAIRDAMLALRGFSSVYGPTQFETDGTVLKPIAVKTIRNGQFVDVRVYGIDEIARM